MDKWTTFLKNERKVNIKHIRVTSSNFFGIVTFPYTQQVIGITPYDSYPEEFRGTGKCHTFTHKATR